MELDVYVKLILNSMMAECAKSFERLPIIEHADLIRNILYSGVWTKYEMLQLKKEAHAGITQALTERNLSVSCGL